MKGWTSDKKRVREIAPNERWPSDDNTYGSDGIVAPARSQGAITSRERSSRKSSEHHEQSVLISWADTMSSEYPELGALYAIPNAAKRGPAVAAMMKREGLKSGVPDICLPCPVGDYGALYIEMKYGKNKPTPNQLAWIDFLRTLSNRVEVCYSFEEARDVVCDYLGINTIKQAA